MDNLMFAILLLCCLTFVTSSDLSIHDYDVQIHPIHGHHGEHHGYATSIRYDKRYHHKIPVKEYAVPVYHQEVPEYHEAPEYQEVPQYHEAPQYHDAPEYHEAPQYQEAPEQHHEVPKYHQHDDVVYQYVSEDHHNDDDDHGHGY